MIEWRCLVFSHYLNELWCPKRSSFDESPWFLEKTLNRKPWWGISYRCWCQSLFQAIPLPAPPKKKQQKNQPKQNKKTPPHPAFVPTSSSLVLSIYIIISSGLWNKGNFLKLNIEVQHKITSTQTNFLKQKFVKHFGDNWLDARKGNCETKGRFILKLFLTNR